MQLANQHDDSMPKSLRACFTRSGEQLGRGYEKHALPIERPAPAKPQLS